MGRILVLSFLSGAAGLIYEVLWARRLALLFGSTALAQPLVLAAFLGGLSAGSAWLGRRADRAKAALRFFADLEWSVAGLGLAAPLFLGLFGGLWFRWPAVAWVLAQAFLMGGAIPALCLAAGGDLQAAVGRIYAFNALGGVCGCLAAGFLAIPALGLHGSFVAAACLNILAGLGARAMRTPPGEASTPRVGAAAPQVGAAAPSAAIDPAPAALPAALVYGAVFLSGFVALTYEIAWTRYLALVVGSSVYSFAEMLAAFIVGIAAGSWLVSGRPARRVDPARLLGLAELGAGASVLLTLPFYDRLPFYFLKARLHFGDGSFYTFEAAKFGLATGLVFAATLCLGMTLPLAARLAGSGPEGRGAKIGAVFASNTAGNVLGALAGLWLLPWLGIEGVLRSGTTVHLAVGAVVLAMAWPMPSGRRRALAVAGLLLFVSYRAWLPRWDVAILAQGPVRSLIATPRLDRFSDFRSLYSQIAVEYYRDDREATVSVVRFPVGVRALKINGKSDASTGADMATQILLGELPLLLKPDARQVLVVGWGSGVTAGSVLRHPVEHLDAVELIGAVAPASRLFDRESGSPRADPRAALHIEDAKTFLARPGRRYDVIVSEPSNPWVAGVGDLFSTEFYRQAHARVAPGGLMMQWFHLYEMNDELFRMVVRTFLSSFPHVALWNILDTDVLLVGSDAPLAPDFAAMERAFKRPEVREDLARARIGRLTTLLALQSASEETVRDLTGPGPLNTELRPALEYGAPRAYFRDEKVAVTKARDDRLGGGRRADLLLARYLKARRRPMNRDEFFDRLRFPHTLSEERLLREFIDDWMRRQPRKAQAAIALAVIETFKRQRLRERD